MTILTLDSPKFGISGEFRAVLRNPDESIAYDSGWEDNLITNLGESLYSILTANFSTYCYIGSGSTSASITSTQMVLFRASQSTYTQTPSASSGGIGPNYERYATRTYRFGAGVGTALITEMGMGGTSNSVGGLFAWHGLTVPINKLSYQSLDVSYRFTVWPSLIESEVINVPIGDEGVLYTCKTSLYNLTYINSGIFGELGIAFQSSGYFNMYNGIKAGPEDTAPSGTTGTTGVSRTVFNGTGAQFDFNLFYPLTAGNTANNILRTATWRTDTSIFYMQTEFTAENGAGIGDGIPKDDQHELTLRFRMNWGRKV